MTPNELKDLFRSEVRDEATPYLWSDVEVFVYMDDAQKMFCRETGGIADSSSPICTLAVTAGDPSVVYDPRILKLRDLRRASDGYNVELVNFEDLNRAGIKFSTVAAATRAAVVGMDANKIRLLSVPTEDGELHAIVYRLPLEDINALSTEFELDAQHHRHLLSWMKHLAHEKQDAETYDRGRSSEFRQKFLEYCAQAKAERERREHKYRTVVYGGY